MQYTSLLATNKFKDKDGLCPEIQTPESCLFDKEYQCWFDNDCNGTKKCCSSGCSLECVDPITSNITGNVKSVDNIIMRSNPYYVDIN